MKTKKLVALVLVAVLAITSIVGTTLAYFTDKDGDKNTMTLGNVKIEQLEKDKAGNPFVDGDLFPMVDNREDGEERTVDGFFNEKMKNVVDKVITVKNNGSEAAYVRTIIAFETDVVYNADGSVYGDAHDVYFGVLGDFTFLKDGENFVKITVNDEEYVLAEKVYEAPLAAGAETAPSLKQFFLAPTANNEVIDLFGQTYTILAVSQAVQSEGFVGGADAALDEAFGDVTAVNAQAWFEAIA